MNDRFVQILEEMGLTRYKLSQMTGISQSTIAEWVNRNKLPRIDKVEAVADALGVSVDYLLGREDGENKTPAVKYDEREVKVLEAFKKLSPELQEATYRFILSLAKNQKKPD